MLLCLCNFLENPEVMLWIGRPSSASYQLRDHDGPEGGEVLRGDAQQENTEHQEGLGGDGRGLSHA